MRTPKRIQLRRTKGWRKPEGAVVVSRPSIYGNPFPVGLHVSVETLNGDKFWDATASDVVFMFKGWTSNGACYPAHAAQRDRLLAAIARGELAGKDLACWCPLDQPCHADVLLELANPANLNNSKGSEPMMTDKHAEGLMRKFKVERLTPSSRGINHDACQYFVLDIDHDRHARAAALAYAQSCELEYPNLARDLRVVVKRPVGAKSVPATAT